MSGVEGGLTPATFRRASWVAQGKGAGQQQGTTGWGLSRAQGGSAADDAPVGGVRVVWVWGAVGAAIINTTSAPQAQAGYLGRSEPLAKREEGKRKGGGRTTVHVCPSMLGAGMVVIGMNG